MNLSDFGGLLVFLNFVIVLVFIFLVLSLVATMMVETVAGYLGTRGKMLRRRLTEMFDDTAETGFAGLLLASPLLRSLGGGGRLPSYIDPNIFAQSVLAIIKEHKIVDARDLPPVLRALALAEGFGTEAERKAFRDRLVEWYDHAMARLSGTFARKAKRNLFIAGLVLAVGFNVDTIAMTKQIWANRFALDEAVQRIADVHTEAAAKAAAENTSIDKVLEEDDELRNKILDLARRDEVLTKLEIPVGWTLRDRGCPDADWEGFKDGGTFEKGGKVLVCTLAQGRAAMWNALSAPADWSILRIVGWFLTALAIMPGTTFWFDILGKVLAIRAAGPKPVTRGKNDGKDPASG